MVLDRIENGKAYHGMNARIRKGLEYLRQTDFSKMEPGKYPIDGDDVFALVQDYSSKALEKGDWEAHRKFIDIQFIVRGTEKMGYAPLSDLEPSTPYDETRDFLLLKGAGSFFNAAPGVFAIFAPEDAHMPGVALTEPSPVRKVVVKVRV